ncbi:alkaline phosphatase family protein [Kozakia baliensis]|uniref:Uncharacterized protein n=1 Tax=Kozakia baliensis TaxID=153496 RepID=A0A1D8UR52_9PROT|nr:ectonucleotide pyrophosphatase/phosphodiesterase [Kozakia baliensis]AOX16086.1 hypothetical protein A0U89_01885 [Kozakia baliensis]GBR23094.1 nucleotide diphosphatase [Kozakia baliensis NRIC 0488]GEL65131.1 alkaline phosphatase family protein [Kozakia baliensis]
MARLSFLLIVLLALTGCNGSDPSGNPGASFGPPPVLLVSIDGFRPDYLHQGNTPTLDRMAQDGVQTGMHPSFPSKTFPNHYTLVTGLRPDHHGIVDNVMRDPTIPDEIFDVGKKTRLDDPRWWNEATPTWVTAQMHGIRTASMFWPGTDVPIQNTRPAEWHHFDAKETPDQRVDTVLSWFKRTPSERPALGLLYFDAVDHAGHKHGPHSEEVAAAAREVDAAMARLLAGLQMHGVVANIIVVSDHGMTEISPQRTITLDTLAPADSMHVVTTGPYAGLDAAPGHERELAAALAKPRPHVFCWPKDRIPTALHYGRNPRVPDFLCLADEGWMIVKDTHSFTDKGAHGYDNMLPSMTALFIAQGPAFTPGAKLAPFDNVDIYPLTMHLLGLLPQPSDGSIAPFQPALRGGYGIVQ